MCESLTKLSKTIEEKQNQLNSLKCLPQMTETIDCLSKCLALLHNNRGFVYYKRVEFNLAANDYSKAIEFDPELAIAYYNRGTIEYRMNHFNNAFKDFKRALDLESNNNEFHLAFEQTLRQLDDQ